MTCFMALNLSTILTSEDGSLSLAPLAHAFGLKETYKTIELVLHLIKHSIYN